MSGVVTAMIAGLCASASPVAAQDLTIRVTPRVVRMTMFAGGTQVRVDGRMAADARAVVVVTGPNVDETFNRKRRFGPVWLNSGKVEVARVPSLFLLLSPAPLGDLLRPDEIDRARLDEAGIKRRMRVRPPDADVPAVRDDYVSLKVGEGRYQFVFDGVRSERDAAGGVASYAAELRWPRTAPPDTYEVTVCECRGGVLTRTATATLEVTRAGMAAVLLEAAGNHAMAYGAIAVLVMMVLGFGIDFLVARVRRLRARRAHRLPRTVARKDIAVH